MNKAELAQVQADWEKARAEVRPVHRSLSYHNYQNILPNVSVRDGFGREDYDKFRPEEQLACSSPEIVRECVAAYNTVPVAHNVINLMSEFSVRGMDLVHPNPEVEKFFKEWWVGVRGAERSERMLNTVFRTGSAVMVMETAKLRLKDEQKLRRGLAFFDPNSTPPPARFIPWRYTIYSPMTVEPVAPELNTFVNNGAGLYAVRIPEHIANKIKNPKGEAEKELVKSLPEDVVRAARSKERLVPLPADRTSAIHFRKDDGEAWGMSVLRPILDQVKLYRKMILADMAALDGAMSKIRVWALGDHKEKLFPSAGDIAQWGEILTSNGPGGVLDVVWRSDVQLIETSSAGHEFLGDEKYKQVLSDIFAGLGVPPTLTGTAGAGTTNNLVSIKTLVERLEYGRLLLSMFWQKQIKLVQEAMGWRFPATLVYDQMVLSDEAAELALLVQLADRDYVSVEFLQERFGAVPEIEGVRLRREGRRRKRKLMPPKAGPFHTAEKDHLKEMAFIGGGKVTPSQVGLDLPPPDPKELLPDPPPAGGSSSPSSKPKGQPQQGRPRNSKDKTKRKKKRVLPVGAALAAKVAAADEAQRKIAEWAHPLYLASLEKGNLRQLTDAEAEALEQFKFDLLYALSNSPLTPETLMSAAERVGEGMGAPEEARLEVHKAALAYEKSTGSRPTFDRLRGIRSTVFACHAA